MTEIVYCSVVPDLPSNAYDFEEYRHGKQQVTDIRKNVVTGMGKLVIFKKFRERFQGPLNYLYLNRSNRTFFKKCRSSK